MTKPRALAKVIAETLIVDVRTVEIYQLLAAENGIKVGFTVYAINYDIDKMIDDLIEDQTKLQLLITNYWELKQFPNFSEIHQGQTLRITANGDGDNVDDEYSIGSGWDGVNLLHPNNKHFEHPRDYGLSVSSMNKTDHHIPLNRMRTIQRNLMKAKDPEILRHANTNYYGH